MWRVGVVKTNIILWGCIGQHYEALHGGGCVLKTSKISVTYFAVCKFFVLSTNKDVHNIIISLSDESLVQNVDVSY